MAKWFGKIGFGTSTEIKPGVWKEVINERNYYGDIIQTVGRPQSVEQLNDNIKINNRMSIVADPYARENFYSIRYIIFEGVKWKVSAAEIQYPRIILDMGEVYNG